MIVAHCWSYTCIYLLITSLQNRHYFFAFFSSLKCQPSPPPNPQGEPLKVRGRRRLTFQTSFSGEQGQAQGECEVRDARQEGRKNNNACMPTIVHAIPPPDIPSNHQPITAFDRSGGMSCFESCVQATTGEDER